MRKPFRIIVVIVAVAIVFILTTQLVMARWALITNIALNPVRVCRDGMYLGVGNQYGPGPVDVALYLMPNGNLIGQKTFNLPPNPVPEVSVKASGYFFFYYDVLVPAGSRIKSANARFSVEDCLIADQPFPVDYLFTSTDVPRPIPPSPAVNVISSTLNVPIHAIISDVDVGIYITHTWDSDLVATLTSPGGTSVLLFDNVGGSGDDFGTRGHNTEYMSVWTYAGFMPDFVLDNESSFNIITATAPFTATSYKPQVPGQLSDFYGKNAAGTWTLTITDTFPTADDGVLIDWALEIKSQQVYLPAIMKSP